MSKLIFGCGYLGSRVARRWLEAGEEVHVVTRSRDRAARLEQDGLRAIVADVTLPETLNDLPPAPTVLYAVGMDHSSGRTMREVYVDGLRAVLDRLPESTSRIIYISSLGVYGQSDGSWIDETSPSEPTREAGRICLAAESLLAEHPLGDRRVVLRLAGLYGGGRVPNRRALEEGEPISALPDAFLNLIHVDDAATVVLAAEHSATEALYLVSDGQPIERREYYREAARRLNAPTPQFAPPSDDAPTRKRGGSNKRASNKRMLQDLSVELRYPSYREGLAAALGD